MNTDSTLNGKETELMLPLPAHEMLSSVYQSSGLTFKSWYRTVYLFSDHWAVIKAQASQLSMNQCSDCGCSNQLDAHHQNYRQIYDVMASDIAIMCRSCHRKSHGLSELDASLKARKKKINNDSNNEVFAKLVHRCVSSYRKHLQEGGGPGEFLAALQQKAETINASVSVPLTDYSLRAVCNSVLRWCVRCTQNFNKEWFSEIQRARGKKSWIKRLNNRQGDFPPGVSIESLKPWVKDGISKATWYRRRRAIKQAAQ